jgi:hypothetical protein
MGFLGDLFGGILGSGAAKDAAEVQANAAKYAADLTAKSQSEALGFAKDVWGTEQKNIAPFLQAGQGAVTTLSSLMPSLTAPWTEKFQAPTADTLKLDPGYQFRLEEGQKALERSAAARGGLTTGGTIKATERYAQGTASQEYQNAYNRALTEYQQAYNIFEQNQANKYNRYAGLAGTGQTATGQLGQEGTAASGEVRNILMGGAANLSQLYQQEAAARASGYVGSANAWMDAINKGSQDIGSLAGLFMGG